METEFVDWDEEMFVRRATTVSDVRVPLHPVARAMRSKKSCLTLAGVNILGACSSPHERPLGRLEKETGACIWIVSRSHRLQI